MVLEGTLAGVDLIGSLGLPFMCVMVFELEQNLEVTDS